MNDTEAELDLSEIRTDLALLREKVVPFHRGILCGCLQYLLLILQDATMHQEITMIKTAVHALRADVEAEIRCKFEIEASSTPFSFSPCHRSSSPSLID